LASSCEATCEICDGNHHQTIHYQKKPDSKETSTNFGKNEGDAQTLLMTAKVKVQTNAGEWIEARALLDGGSQSSFCTESLLRRLELKPEPTSITVNGIAGTVGQILKKVETKMKSVCSGYQRNVELLVVPKLAEKLPRNNLNLSEQKIPKFIKENLADPDFDKVSEIDVLIGVDIFLDILEMEKHVVGIGLPVFQKSKLGWIAGGRIENLNSINGHIFVETRLFQGRQNVRFPLDAASQIENPLPPTP
jgi:hypothetical protein